MKRRDQMTAGNYEVCGMFEPVYMMDRYVGDQPINALFEHQAEALPTRIVHAAHSPGSSMYYFSLESVDWEALPGSYRKTYEL